MYNTFENECIICLNKLDQDIILLECCHKNVHKECLEKWVNTNMQNNRYLRLCPHCKQENNIIKELSNYDENIAINTIELEQPNQNQLQNQRECNNNCIIKHSLLVALILLILLVVLCAIYFSIACTSRSKPQLC